MMFAGLDLTSFNEKTVLCFKPWDSCSLLLFHVNKIIG